jgi:hypothetical protein
VLAREAMSQGVSLDPSLIGSKRPPMKKEASLKRYEAFTKTSDEKEAHLKMLRSFPKDL